MENATQHSVHLTLGMPSAHAPGLGDIRLKLTRPICAIYKPVSHFGFILPSNRVHTTPAHTQISPTRFARGTGRKPFGGKYDVRFKKVREFSSDRC